MKKLTYFLILTFLSVSLMAHAEKMDSETQNGVIERLQRVLSKMDKTDSSWVGSNLRLADLLSERARMRFMSEIEANCQGCKGSEADRKQATNIYESILNKVSAEDQGIVLFQLAHLYDMSSQTSKAIELFNRVIDSKKPRFEASLVARAHEGLGDIYFHTGKFKQAQEHYQAALEDKSTEHRGLLSYRIAWCDFNQDHLARATHDLEVLLSKPELLTKETPQGVVYDPSFHEDVTRDLATFYSRGNVTSEQITRFTQLTPTAERKELLLFFANETDRLGQKKAAKEIYQAYMKEKLTQEERLDALVASTQVNYDMGQSYQSTEDFAVAVKAFKETPCKDEQKCAEIKKRMRRYVTELHRSKKSHVDQDVLKSYIIYVSTFPDDEEMAALGAQVAMDLKQYPDAMTLYHQGAVAADADMRSSGFGARDAKDKAKVEKMRTASVLGEVEAAELSENSAAREKAYKNYLAMMPNGDKQFETRYQLAQLAYEQKQYANAANQFATLALDTKGPMDLRKKSADLTLDCLAIEKNDPEIEKWGQKFAVALPAYKQEYMKLSRKAVTNQVAETANNQTASNSDLKSALEKLRSTSIMNASDVEKIIHYKNEAILAQKVGDNAALLSSLSSLLTIKSLSASDREETLARKEGFFETHLDFKDAYKTALQMRFPHQSEADKQLRLGTLAELAGLNPKRHYEYYLQVKPHGQEALFLRGRLVALSSNPGRELRKQAPELSRDPELLGTILLIVYSRTHDMKSLQSYLRSSRMARTSVAKLFAKQPFYKEQANFSQAIARHRISSRSDRMLNKTIKERVRLLAQADQYVKSALRLNDYTAQIMALTTVSKENYRLVADILALPMPKRLSAPQQQQYAYLLKRQAAPYMNKAQVADAKLQEFWGNTRARQALMNEYQVSQRDIKPMLRFELLLLESLAPNNIRYEINSVLSEKEPSVKDLIVARQAASEDPNNARLLQNLKVLETKFGNPVMATYLDHRLNRSQGKEVL